MDFIIDRPIAFNREYKTITKSTNAALMLSQLIYWWKRKSGETIYKTITEFEDETGLSREEQATAIKNLTALGIISVKVKGVPPIRHFTVHTDKLSELILSICGVATNQYVGLPQNIYTEITTDISTKVERWNKSTKPKADPIQGDVFGGEAHPPNSADPLPTNKEFGNPDINKVINKLSELTPTKKLDGTKGENRQRAFALIKKYGVEKVCEAIDKIPGSPFWNKKITSVRALSLRLNELLAEESFGIAGGWKPKK